MESNLPEENSAATETNTTTTETNAEAGPAIAEEAAAEVSSATEAKLPENSLPEVPVDKPVTKLYSTSLLWLFEVELLNERVTEEIRLLCTIKKNIAAQDVPKAIEAVVALMPTAKILKINAIKQIHATIC